MGNQVLNLRWVVSVVRRGKRQIATAQQGRFTWETCEDAVAWMRFMLAGMSGQGFRQLYGNDWPTLGVARIECWPGHNDPKEIFVPDTQEVRVVYPWEMTTAQYLEAHCDDVRTMLVPAMMFEEWLESQGFSEEDMPSQDDVQAHIRHVLFRLPSSLSPEATMRRAEQVERYGFLRKRYESEVAQTTTSVRVDISGNLSDRAYLKCQHHREVLTAERDGRDIPAYVLAEYKHSLAGTKGKKR